MSETNIETNNSEKTTTLSNIFNEVKTNITGISTRVYKATVDRLTDIEFNRRVELVAAGIEALRQVERDLAKIRPDQTFFGADNKKAAEYYSKAKVEERTKAQQQLDKITKALNLALDNNDYSLLANLKSPAKKDEADSECNQ